MESLKNKSRLTTLAVAIVLGIITYIASMNPNDLANALGVYGNIAPVVIVICGFIINQYSEEERVKRAEELVHKEYTVLGYPKEEDATETETNNTATTDEISTAMEIINQEDETPLDDDAQ